MSECDHSHPWVVQYLAGVGRVDAHPEIDADVFEQMHDLCHSLWAKVRGEESSLAMRYAAGEKVDIEEMDLEEAVVLATVRLLRYRESR